MKSIIKALQSIVCIIAALSAFMVGNTALAEDSAEQLTAKRASAFFASFNENMSPAGLDRWMTNWAEDATRLTPMGNAHGKAEIRKLYEALQGRYTEMRMEIVGLIVQGSRASVQLDTRGVYKATGRTVTMPNVAIVEFNDAGKVKRAQVYMDMKDIARQENEQMAEGR